MNRYKVVILVFNLTIYIHILFSPQDFNLTEILMEAYEGTTYDPNMNTCSGECDIYRRVRIVITIHRSNSNLHNLLDNGIYRGPSMSNVQCTFYMYYIK